MSGYDHPVERRNWAETRYEQVKDGKAARAVRSTKAANEMRRRLRRKGIRPS